MCGFAGFLGGPISGDKELAKVTLEAMTRQISSRGPDSDGVWSQPDDSIALGHRRLSILDLSPAGHQPMKSVSSRYTIAFNGEIYNHLELRMQLDGLRGISGWIGSSDTETLLMCIEIWGVEQALNQINGMFSFALWDSLEKTLTLARDRIGEKPLYYGWLGSGTIKTFLFGSDLKAFKGYPEFSPSVNRDSLCLFLRHKCIPAPHSIYEGFYKLDPGCYLKISANQNSVKSSQYWNAEKLAKDCIANPFEGDFTEASEYVEGKIRKAVSRQTISDVPLGTFLSGGIDSSLITSILQEQSSKPIKTFTIGFEDKAYNEAEYAKKIAEVLGTDHHELYVSPERSLSLIPELPQVYGEPFADSSQIPTLLLSELVKSEVSVALSGDAGDEIFCGYNRYTLADDIWNKLNVLPYPARNFFSIGLDSIPSRLFDMVSAYSKVGDFSSRLAEKVQKVSNILKADSKKSLYYSLTSDWTDPSEWVIDGSEPSTKITSDTVKLDGWCSKRYMMMMDLLTYLPDDILTKVDRASMACSLEVRVPFLDHELVEATFQVPIAHHLSGGKSKAILRDILYQSVPKDLIERPKMGFGVPLDSWLRGPLREWAQDLLDEELIIKQGYLVHSKVTRMWNEHLSGTKNWSGQLWSILMFQAWLEFQ